MSEGEQLRALGDDDLEQVSALGRLVFGGDPAAAARPAPPGMRAWGVFDGERLLAKAALRTYAQWWGGRPVPMGGVASVAVHPDARGRGTARRLMGALLAQMRADGLPVSVLFPTAPGIYRRLGWEVVGSLDETLLPTSSLRTAGDPGAVTVRSAGPEDLPALGRLWREQGESSDGQLTRDGPSYPRGLVKVLAADVVALAEQAGRPAGYLAYDRGKGYGPAAELGVEELVGGTPAAASALLRSVGSWDAVAPMLRWSGSVDQLALLLPGALPPPVRRQPWMLRVVDAPAAVAARGWPAALQAEAAFTLVDPDVPEHEGGWQLTVRDGAGSLRRIDDRPPRLHVRGLALLFAGQADSARLRRAGLLEGSVPALDVLAGSVPYLHDYF